MQKFENLTEKLHLCAVNHSEKPQQTTYKVQYGHETHGLNHVQEPE